jgi:hypothetical protein
LKNTNNNHSNSDHEETAGDEMLSDQEKLQDAIAQGYLLTESKAEFDRLAEPFRAAMHKKQKPAISAENTGSLHQIICYPPPSHAIPAEYLPTLKEMVMGMLWKPGAIHHCSERGILFNTQHQDAELACRSLFDYCQEHMVQRTEPESDLPQ